jgi:transketolase
LFREFGFTADKVVAAAKRSLKAAAVADVIPAVTPDSARTDKPAAKATHRLAAKTSRGK